MNTFHAKLTALRQAFHCDPELGFQEERSKAKVAAYLRDLGLDVHDDGAGVVGVLRAGGGNRVIGLRADMDALPITETAPTAMSLAMRA